VSRFALGAVRHRCKKGGRVDIKSTRSPSIKFASPRGVV